MRATLLIVISSIDYEQSLFCSEIGAEERNRKRKTSVTASLTCETRAMKPRVASRAYRRQHAALHFALAHSRLTACVAFFFALFHTDFRAKEKCLQPRSFLVTSEKSCFFIDMIVINHFEWI